MKNTYTLLSMLFTVFIYAQTAPTTVWSYDLPDKIDRTGPAIADDGTVYIACNLTTRTAVTSPTQPDPNFFAINPDGTKKWETSISEGGFLKPDAILSSPSINADGSIYMGGQYGRIVFRLNAATGDSLSTKYIDTRMRYTAPVFSTSGDVYISGYSRGNRGVRSLSADLTTEKWVFGVGNDFNSTPAVGTDGTIYAVSTNDSIYAINPAGTEKWRAYYGDWVASAIALASDGTVYLSAKLNGAADGVLKAYNPTDGSEKWSVTFTGENAEQGGPAVAADGTVYLGTKGGKMHAFNSTDGSIKWTYTATAAIEVVPAIDNDGKIYFGSTDGNFHVLNSTGTEAYSTLDLGDNINSSAAIGSNGRIYVGATDGGVGKLYALQTTATGLQTGGWPMYGRNPKHSSNVNAIALSIPNIPTTNKISAYPNPANNGEFYISSALNGAKSIQIFDVLGKQVYSKYIEANEMIRTSNLKSGLYIIRVTENDKLATLKLVIN